MGHLAVYHVPQTSVQIAESKFQSHKAVRRMLYLIYIENMYNRVQRVDWMCRMSNLVLTVTSIHSLPVDERWGHILCSNVTDRAWYKRLCYNDASKHNTAGKHITASCTFGSVCRYTALYYRGCRRGYVID